QIPNFTYPDTGPAELFDAVAAQAREADTSGFDTVLVMDHFYQLPSLGPPDAYMLECYSLLAALARETTNVRLSALVTGNTYRNPAILAKTVTTLDIVSNSRAQLGRCGMVRTRARRIRDRVRDVHRSVREARGGAAD